MYTYFLKGICDKFGVDSSSLDDETHALIKQAYDELQATSEKPKKQNSFPWLKVLGGTALAAGGAYAGGKYLNGGHNFLTPFTDKVDGLLGKNSPEAPTQPVEPPSPTVPVKPDIAKIMQESGLEDQYNKADWDNMPQIKGAPFLTDGPLNEFGKFKQPVPGGGNIDDYLQRSKDNGPTLPMTEHSGQPIPQYLNGPEVRDEMYAQKMERLNSANTRAQAQVALNYLGQGKPSYLSGTPFEHMRKEQLEQLANTGSLDNNQDKSFGSLTLKDRISNAAGNTVGPAVNTMLGLQAAHVLHDYGNKWAPKIGPIVKSPLKAGIGRVGSALGPILNNKVVGALGKGIGPAVAIGSAIAGVNSPLIMADRASDNYGLSEGNPLRKLNTAAHLVGHGTAARFGAGIDFFKKYTGTNKLLRGMGNASTWAGNKLSGIPYIGKPLNYLGSGVGSTLNFAGTAMVSNIMPAMEGMQTSKINQGFQDAGTSGTSQAWGNEFQNALNHYDKTGDREYLNRLYAHLYDTQRANNPNTQFGPENFRGIMDLSNMTGTGAHGGALLKRILENHPTILEQRNQP